MKSLFFATTAMFTVLTAVEPIWAADDTSSVRTSISGEESGPTRLSDLDMHINPQLGVSSFEYSHNSGGGQQRLIGGATAEFGNESRKLETGLIFLQTGADATINNGTVERINTSYLTLPMMAKLRIMQMRAQSWYFKFGFATALRLNTNDTAATNSADVLAGIGLAGRFALAKKSDFIVEATYNRGLMEAIHTQDTTAYNQGFVILAGLSFHI